MHTWALQRRKDAGEKARLPWVKQWHADPNPFYGGISPAEFLGQQLDNRDPQVERTAEQLAEWRPHTHPSGPHAQEANRGS